MPLILVTLFCVLLSPPQLAPPPTELIPELMPPAGLLSDIPPPRERGRPGPPPPMMVTPTHIRPEAIQGWVSNLGSENFHLREEAEAGLILASWEGYRAACVVAASSENAESRARAARVCSRYLGMANLEVMATRFVPYKPATTAYELTVPAHYRPVPKIYTLCSRRNGTIEQPPHQYTLALFCHYYTLKAIRVSWECNNDGSRSAVPEWCANCVQYEILATQLMVRDMLASGFNPLWVRWLLDDMDTRQNYWPPALKRPPQWLLDWVGVEMTTPFPP